MQALQPPTLQPRQPRQPPQPLPTAPQPLPTALQPLPAAPQPLQPLPARCANCWPDISTSLSKTKNVPKLTSKISSSWRVTCGGVSRNCTSGVGPTAPVADAPPVIAIDRPTAPATGTAFLKCFCVLCGIFEISLAALFIRRRARTPRKLVTSRAAQASPLQPHGRLRNSRRQGVDHAQRVSVQLVPRCRKIRAPARRRSNYSAYIDALTENLRAAYNCLRNSASRAVPDQGGAKAMPCPSLYLVCPRRYVG